MCSTTQALTGGMAGSPSGSYAAAAHRQNAQQQAGIDYGLQQINAIFGGGSYPIYSLAGGTYNPGQSYYTYNKNTGQYNPYTAPGWYTRHQGHQGLSNAQLGAAAGAGVGTAVMPGVGTVAGGMVGSSIGSAADSNWLGAATGLGAFGIGGSSRRPSPQAVLNHGKLYAMSQSPEYKGFDNQFFADRGQAYVNYATPQLAEQYKQTQDAMRMGLANRGLLRSSVAGQEQRDLDLSMGQQRQGIYDTATGQANQLRTDIENARQQAISQLYAGVDPSQAAASALRSANSFTAPSQFTPLANGFQNLISQYQTQQAIAGYNQPYQPNYYSGYTSPMLGALPQNS